MKSRSDSKSAKTGVQPRPDSHINSSKNSNNKKKRKTESAYIIPSVHCVNTQRDPLFSLSAKQLQRLHSSTHTHNNYGLCDVAAAEL